MPAKSTRKTQSASKRARSPDRNANEDKTTTAPPQKRSKTDSFLVNASKEEFVDPGVTDSVAGSERSESSEPESPALTGRFDLYMMDLPFLSKVYLPASTSEPQYEDLYQAILKVQTKRDYTARCLIPESPFITDGQLVSRTSVDAMEEILMPFDIAITDLKLVHELSFSSTERSKFVSPPQSCPGITGRTQLAEDHCGIQSASGVFRMQHAWTGAVDGQDIEIFEGYLSFNVVHSGLYRRKGHGGGSNSAFGFWAVRARRDANGKEIGLTDRK
ncbi:hypothetical protein DFH07DRAFT_1058070 [Mycena maculata]|uniref:Uncharacterized protein n=1 Tax=Mycena maculata TaxID=230809 RepID=A0AAD7JU16_9AGAR|nr:hypothetical protein DFH07DRAFT_1058070 [Mycena maculata]